LAASASSYASSTVCGTIVRSSCSRSQGHSRRSRCVISSSRAIADATSAAEAASSGDSATYFEELELVVEDFLDGVGLFLVGAVWVEPLVTVGVGVVVGAVALAVVLGLT